MAKKLKLKKLAFIGGGAMGEAIIKGITGAKLMAPAAIYVGAHRPERAAYLHATYGVTGVTDNGEAVRDADMVILAIKPQMADSVLSEELARTMPPETVIVSIMGSVPIAKIVGFFPGHPVIRTMPNTPLAVGTGMTAIAPGTGVTPEMLAAANTIFSCCGETLQIEEKDIEAVTAVSGCGPGYVYVLIDALADAGVMAGLPRAAAIRLAAQTFAGAGKMVLETGSHPAALRDMVTSPGGTTIAGIKALENGAVRGAMYNAVEAVLARSEALKGNKK